MKKDNAKIDAPVQQSNEARKKLKLKTSAQTGNPDPQLPCQLMIW